MIKRVVPFPDGAQQYLEETFGFPKYSTRHLNLLITQNKFPRPIKISDRRQASVIDDLDAYAEKKLAQAENSQTTPAPISRLAPAGCAGAPDAPGNAAAGTREAAQN